MTRLAASLAASTCLAAVLVGCGGGTLGGGADAGAGGRGGFGNSGIGGAGGSGIGVGGRAGTGSESPCFSTPYENPNCLAGLCGNGVRDTCTMRAVYDFCPNVNAAEICDGGDVGAATCVGLGYGSGTLACDDRCAGVDTSGCKECAALDAGLIRCGDAPFGRGAVQAVIAATDTEIGVAWVDLDSAGQLQLAFARLSPSLDLLSMSRVTDPSTVLNSLQIAALASGWLVAGFGGPESVVLQPFDAMGEPLPRTTVDTLPTGVYHNAFALAPRPSGGPLLLWTLNDAMRVAMVAADGRSAAAPRTLTTDDIIGNTFGVTWVGDTFHVVMTLERGNNPDQLHFKRVDATGNLTAAFDALPGVSVWDPSLVTGAGDLRLVYTGEVGAPVGEQRPRSVKVQRLDATGNAIGAAVAVGAEAEYQWALGVAFGADTGLVVRGFGSPLTMASVRLGSDGRLVSPLHDIARGETLSQSWVSGIVRRGSELITLWVPDRYLARPIQLARVVL